MHPLGPQGIQWNYRIVEINRVQRKVSFIQGHTVIGVDLVIGADGINGPVRSFKYDSIADTPLNYLGILVVLGITGYIDHFLTKDRVFQTMDGCFRLFAMPFQNLDQNSLSCGSSPFPATLDLSTQLSRNPERLKQMLLEKCADWHSPIPEMIERTQLDLLMGIPAFDRDMKQISDSEKDGIQIALLGDAAHPMSPFKGQGANQALLDAVDLADIIAQNNNLDLNSAISQYEDQMLKRVYTKVMQSRERVTSFHRPEALATQNFLYRGVNEELIKKLNSLGINAQWNDPNASIEQAIIEKLNGKQEKLLSFLLLSL